MAANIQLPVPTWARVTVVLVAFALLAASVVCILLGNKYAAIALTPSSIIACKVARYAFNK